MTAESAYKKAMEQYPESALIAYQLGRALRCQQTSGPEKVPQALYEFARAAALDPTLGGTMDPKALNNYLESAYSSFHGSLEGLDQLKTHGEGFAAATGRSEDRNRHGDCAEEAGGIRAEQSATGAVDADQGRPGGSQRHDVLRKRTEGFGGTAVEGHAARRQAGLQSPRNCWWRFRCPISRAPRWRRSP